ncbi:MAG: hypothetical protein IKE56_08420 [Lachnospiraceae bacterium]|nr:hypothetical protein [Lachnospiraceae bacterium]
MSKNTKHFRSGLLAASLAAVVSICSVMPSYAFYQQPAGKKGILNSGQTEAHFQDLTDLGVDQVICNIATDQGINAYSQLASYCKTNGKTLTMIVINRAGAGELVPTSEAVAGIGAPGTYGFNVLTDSGKAAVRSYAARLADFYKDSVSNWVIGNEVNDAVSWDFNGIMDMDAHADTYAEAFRIFYEEIKAANPEARVFIPFDNRWQAGGWAAGHYPAAKYLPMLNERLNDLDYGVAWHAYPGQYQVRPEFADDVGTTQDLSTSMLINMNNIHLISDFLQQPEMLSPAGTVRHLILSEQGFTSSCENGEERQAQAIADAFAIANADPYIEGFYLTRQVDAASQVAINCAFGLRYRDESAGIDEMPAGKKKAWSVYQSLH